MNILNWLDRLDGDAPKISPYQERVRFKRSGDTGGAFGKRKYYPEFNGKVIRRSDRTKDNCNQCGVAI